MSQVLKCLAFLALVTAMCALGWLVIVAVAQAVIEDNTMLKAGTKHPHSGATPESPNYQLPY